MAPTMAPIIRRSGRKLVYVRERIKVGIIFCQVNKINKQNRFKFSIIWGSQKWNGGIPAFMAIETLVNSLKMEKLKGELTFRVIMNEKK